MPYIGGFSIYKTKHKIYLNLRVVSIAMVKDWIVMRTWETSPHPACQLWRCERRTETRIFPTNHGSRRMCPGESGDNYQDILWGWNIVVGIYLWMEGMSDHGPNWSRLILTRGQFNPTIDSFKAGRLKLPIIRQSHQVTMTMILKTYHCGAKLNKKKTKCQVGLILKGCCTYDRYICVWFVRKYNFVRRISRELGKG